MSFKYIRVLPGRGWFVEGGFGDVVEDAVDMAAEFSYGVANRGWACRDCGAVLVNVIDVYFVPKVHFV